VNGRQLAGLVIAVLVGLSVYFAWPKEKLSPEDEIRALVARMIVSAEKRDPAGVTAEIAESFSGGGLRKQELKQLIVGQFFQARQIVVLNPLLDVSVKSPSEGSIHGTFLFGRDGAGPEASRYTIDAELMKTSDGWQIVSASWSR
jgi:hypothetical protein